jgi:choline dehydrogenase-like flavoprotein
VLCDAADRVSGVSAMALDADPARSFEVRARAVVLCAGAIETARLLLASACAAHPAGVGHAREQVGRHLQGHVYAGAYGVFDRVVQESEGPGPSVSTCEFNHGNADVIGGGMLANDFVTLPVMFWHLARPPGTPVWGAANKEWMRRDWRRTALVMGPTQEIPSPSARVELDPRLRDRAGMPVARLSGGLHPETLRAAAVLRARAEEWLRAAGARRAWSFVASDGRSLSAGQHQAGTCRIGVDPQGSVTAPDGRVHGMANLWIADASLHVTNGGFNPVLTVFALAYRVAERLAQSLRTYS